MAKQGFRVQCYIDGIRLVELSNVQFTGASGKTRVETLEGFIAFVQGTKSFQLQATWGWFTTGPEVDFITWCADASEHSVQFPLGNGKSIISVGQFTECGGSQSTNAAAEMTATFDGTFEKPR